MISVFIADDYQAFWCMDLLIQIQHVLLFSHFHKSINYTVGLFISKKKLRICHIEFYSFWNDNISYDSIWALRTFDDA
jgi:hypothetical protein